MISLDTLEKAVAQVEDLIVWGKDHDDPPDLEDTVANALAALAYNFASGMVAVSGLEPESLEDAMRDWLRISAEIVVESGVTGAPRRG